MNQFITVHEINGNVCAINLSTIIRIEKSEAGYLLYFNFTITDGKDWWIHNIEVVDNLEEQIPCMVDLNR